MTGPDAPVCMSGAKGGTLPPITTEISRVAQPEQHPAEQQSVKEFGVLEARLVGLRQQPRAAVSRRAIKMCIQFCWDP